MGDEFARAAGASPTVGSSVDANERLPRVAPESRSPGVLGALRVQLTTAAIAGRRFQMGHGYPQKTALAAARKCERLEADASPGTAPTFSRWEVGRPITLRHRGGILRGGTMQAPDGRMRGAGREAHRRSG